MIRWKGLPEVFIFNRKKRKRELDSGETMRERA